MVFSEYLMRRVGILQAQEKGKERTEHVFFCWKYLLDKAGLDKRGEQGPLRLEELGKRESIGMKARDKFWRPSAKDLGQKGFMLNEGSVKSEGVDLQVRDKIQPTTSRASMGKDKKWHKDDDSLRK